MLEDDEMMRQWEVVTTEEERITMRRSEGRELKVERLQGVPTLVVTQAQMKGV